MTEKAIDCIDGKEQCMVTDGSLEECSPASKSFFRIEEELDVTESVIRFTLAGSPNSHSGVLFVFNFVMPFFLVRKIDHQLCGKDKEKAMREKMLAELGMN
ncbi:hypothetical protein BSKO_08219 [Bryopsis sp. KO-2023]|nr:hypothetical protein BSKO_08219 [Bryopsis sp. KO-2023]